MDIEDKEITNPFFIIHKRSEWYQCAQCHSDLRTSEHSPDCKLNPVEKAAATKHVQMVIKSYFNAKGLKTLKGGK